MNPTTSAMRPRQAVPALAGLLFLLVAGPAASDCIHTVAGYDTVGWNSSRGTFLGKAVGQTFYAADTVIDRITV